jgi:hypothetical protein
LVVVRLNPPRWTILTRLQRSAGAQRTDQPVRASTRVRSRPSALSPNHPIGWAQEAADRGDYADALEWVRTVEAIGEQLSPSYQTQRQAWRSALAQNAAKRQGS